MLSKVADSNKRKIGITGGIGSGKSVFSAALKEKGFPVILADDIAKEILANDPEVRAMIIKEFGQLAFPGNKLDRKYLAEKVFPDPVKVEIINSIIHPPAIQKINSLMKSELLKQNIVFVEAALIYESELEGMFDLIVLITAEDEIKMKRKIAQGMSESDFLTRLQHQIKDEEKAKIADFIFINNGDKKDLYKKAELLLKLIT
ncbi:MAG: dephospho-CoA kinase [Ignavibacteriaceae bacterium]|nr:dephospho-CoA kinase [Ignavibacteriaceae bacterium]